MEYNLVFLSNKIDTLYNEVVKFYKVDYPSHFIQKNEIIKYKGYEGEVLNICHDFDSKETNILLMILSSIGKK